MRVGRVKQVVGSALRLQTVQGDYRKNVTTQGMFIRRMKCSIYRMHLNFDSLK